MNYANLINFQGSDGIITDLNYALPITRLYMSGVGSPNGRNPHQIIGDLSINNLFMNGVPASPWLQTDASFSALPNGTTLHLGDIIEVPAVWKASSPRYNLYSVVQEGTTGTLNSGSTTCTTGIANWLTVSSVTGLMLGQHINCGANTNMVINNINASNPTAVLVYAVWSTSVGSPVTLSYSAPVLSPEIQFPIKAAGAPGSGTWIQGDQSQNTNAAANGIAGYVNVAGGTPGTWAAIPAFDINGQMAASQVQSKTGTGNKFVLDTAPTITNLTSVGTSATNACPNTQYGYGSGNGTTQHCIVTGTLAASPTNNTQKVTIVTTGSTYPVNHLALDIDLTPLGASTVESSHWKIVGDTTNGFNASQNSQEQDPLLAGTSKIFISTVTVTNSTTIYFYVSSTNTVSGQNWQADITSYNYSAPNISSITVAATQSLSPTRAPYAALLAPLIGIPYGNGTTPATVATQAQITAAMAAQYKVGSCTEAWGGSGTSFALTSGDDAVVNNTCYNDSGVTRTITAVKCRSSAASNTTTVNPTFGSVGTGTTILSGALTCGNSYAYSSTGTVSNASWTTGTGIDPAMAGTLTGTSIAMIVEYTY